MSGAMIAVAEYNRIREEQRKREQEEKCKKQLKQSTSIFIMPHQTIMERQQSLKKFRKLGHKIDADKYPNPDLCVEVRGKLIQCNSIQDAFRLKSKVLGCMYTKKKKKRKHSNK